RAFADSADLEDIRGYVDDSGEGRWTVQEAIDQSVPAPVITLSPCAMCSGAILLYGIPRVVVGENRTFRGEEELLRSRGVVVEVRQEPECERILGDFIREHPALWDEDIGR
nr:hypothetical protein [Gemmatimonadales bacterium]